MGDAMVTERDHSNEIIRSKTKKVNAGTSSFVFFLKGFIPDCVVVSQETGQLLPLRQCQRVVLSM